MDDAIQATQAVIDQTRKVKQGLLQQLLTRGIGHTRFKQTEIGEIPESWTVRELGDFLPQGSIRNGLYKPAEYYGQGTAIIRINSFDLGDRIDRRSNLQLLQLAEDEIDRFSVQQGDLLINRVNSLSHLGKVALVSELEAPTVFESNMMCLRLNPLEVVPDYALLQLASPRARRFFQSRAKKAVAQASINQQDVRAFTIPVPTVAEQMKIIEAVDAVSSPIALADAKLRALNTAKAGLMADLLTGRKRVEVSA